LRAWHLRRDENRIDHMKPTLRIALITGLLSAGALSAAGSASGPPFQLQYLPGVIWQRSKDDPALRNAASSIVRRAARLLDSLLSSSFILHPSSFQWRLSSRSGTGFRALTSWAWVSA
jgi:hypothetical protein